VRFDAGEAIAHLMPVQRGMFEQWEPEIVSMRENLDLLDQFTRWSASRDAFHAQIARRPTSKSAMPGRRTIFAAST
jgi:hypothetical protein